MAACVATLNRLRHPDAYANIEARGTRLMQGIRTAFHRANIPASVEGFPSIFHVAIGLEAPARNWSDLLRMDRPRYIRFTTALLERGVRALERGAWFLSTEHDDAVIDATLEAVEKAVRVI